MTFAANAACRDRAAEFTSDHHLVTLPELRDMQQVCAACPVFDLCADYRDEIRPTCGVWAGELCVPLRVAP